MQKIFELELALRKFADEEGFVLETAYNHNIYPVGDCMSYTITNPNNGLSKSYDYDECAIESVEKEFNFIVNGLNHVIMTKSYEDGLNEAWELVSKLCDYAPEVRADIFNYDNIKNTSIKNIIRDHYPQEVASMIEEYELVRNLKVGDVVSGVDDEIGIVTRAAANGVGPYIMWSDGSCGVQEYVGDLKKTGQNLDISGLLKSIEKKGD